MNHSESHQMYQNGEETYHLGIVCFFLKNCCVCFNGSRTNTLLNTSPPLTEEYPPLDEDFELHVSVPLADFYNYGNLKI